MAKVGTTMNTDSIIKAIVEKSKEADYQFSQVEVHEVISLMKEVVMEALQDGQKVQMTGFITFTPSWRAPRKGNNVITSEPMDIPGCVIVNAKAGKALKDAVRNISDDVSDAIKAQKESK